MIREAIGQEPSPSLSQLTIDSLLVPPQEEQEYCDRNNMTLQRYSNGAVLVGAHKGAEDEAYLSVTYRFPTGSYFDPTGKSGIHHLMEHRFDHRPLRAAGRHRAHSNASTGFVVYDIDVWGIANPRFQDYGVWPVLPIIQNSIRSPISDDPESRKQLEEEKGTVVEEINEEAADYTKKALHAFVEILFDPTNPERINILGNADILIIDVDDIQRLADRVLIPDGLIVRALSEGDEAILGRAVYLLSGQIDALPRADRKRQPFDRALFDRLNKGVNAGNKQLYDTGFGNGRVFLRWNWFSEVGDYEDEAMALEVMEDPLKNLFFEFIRGRGPAYSADSNLYNEGPNLKIMTLHAELSRREQLEDFVGRELWQMFQSTLSRGLDEDELSFIASMHQKGLKAIPISKERRLNHAQLGLELYGQMLDADNVVDRYARVGIADLRRVRDKILDEPPFVAIIGDVE